MKITLYSLTTPTTAAQRKNIDAFYTWLYNNKIKFNEINSVSLNENVMTTARTLGVMTIPALVAVLDDGSSLIETDPSKLDDWLTTLAERVS